MKINEISKIPARDFSGEDELYDYRFFYRDSTEFKKFSDSDLYYWNDINNGKILIAIPNTDVDYPAPNGLITVGVLTVLSKKITNIYNKPIIQVGEITVDKQFRGEGIANRLYDVALKSGYILFSGERQTPGGRAMWSNLYRRPDVEVTGWVEFNADNDYYGEYSDDDFIKFIEQQGGAYLGERSAYYQSYGGNTTIMYFEFEVERLPTKAQLEIRGKRSPIKVYNKNISKNISTGLMARYIG
jgi:hypothetical protein